MLTRTHTSALTLPQTRTRTTPRTALPHTTTHTHLTQVQPPLSSPYTYTDAAEKCERVGTGQWTGEGKASQK